MSDSDLHRSSRFDSTIPAVSVHVLGEHVFCPRAAQLAVESKREEEEEVRPLGPRLDWFGDFDERRFAEALHLAWREFWICLTFLTAATMVAFAVGYATTWFWGWLASLFAVALLMKLWHALLGVIQVVRERSALLGATPVEIDPHFTDIRPVNWWALRRAGYDCRLPQEKNYDSEECVAGKPWRILVKDNTIHIPVIKKLGDHSYGKQHIVRLAAHCRLMEACENARAPFGVLIFSGSSECVLFPYGESAKLELADALHEVREFLMQVANGTFKMPHPTDRRCSGCHHGRPRSYIVGISETVLNGLRLLPRLGKSAKGGRYHCTCGDRYDWVPGHRSAITLGIAKEDE